jgi:hypothetical protein
LLQYILDSIVCIDRKVEEQRRMKKRITLTIDPEVAGRARSLALQRHTTVSGMVEDFLRRAAPETAEAPSFSRRWRGRFALRSPTNGRDPRLDGLLRKHGTSAP